MPVGGFIGGLMEAQQQQMARDQFQQEMKDKAALRQFQQQEMQLQTQRMQQEQARLDQTTKAQTMLANLFSQSAGKGPEETMGEAGMNQPHPAAQKAMAELYQNPMYASGLEMIQKGKQALAIPDPSGASQREAMSLIQRGKEMQSQALMMQRNDRRDEMTAKRDASREAHERAMENIASRREANAQAAREAKGDRKDYLTERDLYDRSAKEVKPLQEIGRRIDIARQLLETGLPIADKQLQGALVDVFNNIRATNHLYQDQANFGDLYNRMENAVSRIATGTYSEANRQEIRTMLDNMDKNVVTPAYQQVKKNFEEAANDYGVNPKRSFAAGSRWREAPPATAQAKEAAKASEKGLTFNPAQESWISQTLKNNPGATRADVINALKAAGKL